jgi:hypothetical protein
MSATYWSSDGTVARLCWDWLFFLGHHRRLFDWLSMFEAPAFAKGSFVLIIQSRHASGS